MKTGQNGGRFIQDVETHQMEGTSRRLFSRDVNYVRDLLLFWPFLFSALMAASIAFSRDWSDGVGLKVTILAAVCFLLAKERLFLLFVAFGFIAFQGTWSLIVHPWSWPTFAATVLSAGAVRLGDRYWRRPKLAYALPTEYGLVDMLLTVASICGSLAMFYLLKHV